MTISARNLSLSYQGPKVIDGLDLDLPAGQVTALIGPNGCGKSTLLQALAGLARPDAGTVTMGGAPLRAMSRRQIARRLAYLPQNPAAPEGITVEGLARHGRFPHLGLLGAFGPADHAAVARALTRTGLSAKAERPLTALSGGERQRAWIAALLAQEADTLMMDEPTSFLDIGHQVEVMELIDSLCRTEGKTVIVVLHDISHAVAVADHLVVMQSGCVCFEGPPCDVIETGIVNEVFGVQGCFRETGPGEGHSFCPLMRLEKPRATQWFSSQAERRP